MFPFVLVIPHHTFEQNIQPHRTAPRSGGGSPGSSPLPAAPSRAAGCEALLQGPAILIPAEAKAFCLLTQLL